MRCIFGHKNITIKTKNINISIEYTYGSKIINSTKYSIDAEYCVCSRCGHKSINEKYDNEKGLSSNLRKHIKEYLQDETVYEQYYRSEKLKRLIKK